MLPEPVLQDDLAGQKIHGVCEVQKAFRTSRGHDCELVKVNPRGPPARRRQRNEKVASIVLLVQHKQSKASKGWLSWHNTSESLQFSACLLRIAAGIDNTSQPCAAG